MAPSTVRLTMRRLRGCRAELAVAGRADRYRAGGAAVPAAGTQAGPPASGRARLGEHPPRAQAQARHAVDAVGEYIARDPDGYRYSRFCELYRAWEAGCR